MTELEQQLHLLAAEIEWPRDAGARAAGPARAAPPLAVAAAARCRRGAAGRGLRRRARAGSAERDPPLVPDRRRIRRASADAASGRAAVARRPRSGGRSARPRRSALWAHLVRLPRGAGARLYLQGGVVSALLETDAGTVLFSELRSHDLPMLLKKLASGSTKRRVRRRWRPAAPAPGSPAPVTS